MKLEWFLNISNIKHINTSRDAINETSFLFSLVKQSLIEKLFLSTLIEQSLYQHKIFMALITYRSHMNCKLISKGPDTNLSLVIG